MEKDSTPLNLWGWNYCIKGTPSLLCQARVGRMLNIPPLPFYPSLLHSVLGDLLWRATPPTHTTGPSGLSSRGVELRGGEMQLAGGVGWSCLLLRHPAP